MLRSVAITIAVLTAKTIPFTSHAQERGLLTGIVTRIDKTPIENARVKVVGTDIIAALKSGVLSGASLDVFEQEPLDRDSPFWDMDNVYVTPHVAASSDVKALFVHAEQQMDRFESGLPLEHLVDRTAGY